MSFGWEGRGIRLVPLDREKHLDNCIRWLNDTEITNNLCVGHYPMTREMESAWFDRMLAGSHSDVVFAIETLEGQHIGQSGLHDIHPVHRSAISGSFIGPGEMRGKGYGTQAAIIRARYAFEVLGLRILYAEFLDGNEASKRMQIKSGYKIYGTKPKAYFKNGQVRDSCLTYITREMFEDANPV